MTASVLVTDGEQRAALAVVRSLGRAGYRVIVTSESGASLAGASRFAHADVMVPSALKKPQEFSRAIQRVQREMGVEVIIPVAEPSVLAIMEAEGSFGRARLPFPDREAFRRVSDKVEVSRSAERFGISVPAQAVINDAADVALLPPWIGSGAVLKPGRSINAGRKLTVSYVAPGDDPHKAIRELPSSAFPLLVQQRIRGPGAGVFLLRWNGTTLAAFAHERVREKPPSGGVSVVRVSAPLDQDLLKRSELLLDSFDWSGVAMLEYKRSETDGQPYLMEINGRFWGSLQLAIDAGVDFPRMLVDVTLGQRPTRVQAYRIGVRSRWLMGDVDHLISRMLKSREILNLPPDAPGRLRVLGAFLRDFLPPNRLEVLQRGDIRPFLREVRLWLLDAASGSRDEPSSTAS